MSDPRSLIGPTDVALLGRALLAPLFMLAGVAKIARPAPFLDHMREFSVPTALLPAVIVLELGAGLALRFGWRVRDAAGALAVFCILTALLFHRDLTDKVARSAFF